MKLKIKPNEIKDFRSFEKAVKRQFGENAYVGTDHMVVVLDYPKRLKENLRPYPSEPIKEEITFEW